MHRNLKIIIVATAALSLMAPATAATNTRISATHSIGSGTWSALIYGQNQSPSNIPYQLTWGTDGLSSYDYITVSNNGTFTILSATLLVTQVKVSGTTRLNNITFDLCVNGVWNTSTNTCPTSTVLIGKASDQIITISNLNLLPLNILSIRAFTDTNSRQSYTTSLSISVSRSGIRTASILNS